MASYVSINPLHEQLVGISFTNDAVHTTLEFFLTQSNLWSRHPPVMVQGWGTVGNSFSYYSAQRNVKAVKHLRLSTGRPKACGTSYQAGYFLQQFTPVNLDELGRGTQRFSLLSCGLWLIP